jgi:hypothetical protein
LTKAHGKVTLPLSVYWSGPSVYDLDDPWERARAYEQVLREGTDDDVRRFVEVDQVIELWTGWSCPPRFAVLGRTGSVSTAA